MVGLTFDTGAMLALERRNSRMRRVVAAARRERITVPTPVITEWWRGRTDVREQILASVTVETLTRALARTAGEAIAAVPGATPIDAIVMASAASRGDIVYTSDFHDLDALRAFFPNVRVLRC
jgi:predicted nucleic acid-binding protein